MFNLHILLLFVFSFAVLNRLRGSNGSSISSATGINWTYSGNLIFTIVWGAYMCLIFDKVYPGALNTLDYLQVFVLSMLGTYIGESFGWGKWIGQISNGGPSPYNKEGRKYGIHFLANLLANEMKYPRVYAWLALWLRGIYWFLPALAPLYAFNVLNLGQYLAGSVIIGFGFGTSFLVAAYLPKVLTKRVTPDGYWHLGETLYGIWQGICLYGIYMVAV